MYKHNYIPSFGLIFLAEGRLITCGERLKVYCDPLPGKSNCRNGRGANFIKRVASVHLAKTSFSPKSHSKRSYKITAVGRKRIYMYFESLPRDIIPPPRQFHNTNPHYCALIADYVLCLPRASSVVIRALLIHGN